MLKNKTKLLIIFFIIVFLLSIGAVVLKASHISIEHIFNDVWNSTTHTLKLKGV